MAGLGLSAYKNSVLILFCHNNWANFILSVNRDPILATMTSVSYSLKAYPLVMLYSLRRRILSIPTDAPQQATFLPTNMPTRSSYLPPPEIDPTWGWSSLQFIDTISKMNPV